MSEPSTAPAKAEPIAVKVTRHLCPHCRRGHSKKAAAVAHMDRCWVNPGARGCKTCLLYTPGCEGPYPQHPYIDEDCPVHDLSAGLRTGCPDWRSKTTPDHPEDDS